MTGALLLGYFVARLRDHPEDSVAHPFLTTGVDAGHLGLAAAYIGATLAVADAFVRVGIALERRRALRLSRVYDG